MDFLRRVFYRDTQDGKKQEAVVKDRDQAESEAELRQKAAAACLFVENAQETMLEEKQKASSLKPSFVRDYNLGVDDTKWTHDHFFHRVVDGGVTTASTPTKKTSNNKKNSDHRCGVCFTSYQLHQLNFHRNKTTSYKKMAPFHVRAPALPKDNDDDASETNTTAAASAATPTTQETAEAEGLIRFDKLSFSPIPTLEPGGDVDRFLIDLRDQTPETFHGDMTATQVLVQLTSDPGGAKLLKKLPPDLKADVELFAQAHWKGVIDGQVKPGYALLHDYAGGKIDEDHYELMIGLCHVRKIYTKRGNSPQLRIFNGPLIEYRVVVKRSNDGKSLFIVPAPDGRVKWNNEAKATLLYDGKNRKVLERFKSILSESRPTDFVPGDPTTYEKFMSIAADFDCNSIIKSHTGPSVSALPDDHETLVLSPGWVLFLRRKRTTPVSEDMRNLARAINEKNFELSGPLRGFIGGADSSSKLQKKTNGFGSAFCSGEPMLPLPATTNQRELITRAICDDSPFSQWQGCPGAGKTSNAINLCSLELQQGRSVLYCSASAKPLKELFLRLPAEMRKICLDVSSLEYNDDEDAAIKDFCNRLECMQVDLNPMQNEEQKYNKKKEELRKEIERCKKQIVECTDSISANTQTNRKLMKDPMIQAAVRRFVQSDSKIVHCVLALFRNRGLDLGEISSKVKKLIQDQRSETYEISQVVNWSLLPASEITNDIIDFVKQKAQAYDESTKFRSTYTKTTSFEAKVEQLRIRVRTSANDVTEKAPNSPDEWGVILRGLQLRLDLVNFHQSLPNDFQTSDICCADNIRIREDFSELLSATHRDLLEVSEDDQHELLKAFDNVRSSHRLHNDHSKLLLKLQTLKQTFSEANLALATIKCTTDREIGMLSTLGQFASNMKSGDRKGEKRNSKEESIRRNKNFEKAFRDCLPCARFVLMTTEQVSRLIPPDFKFDRAIVDEASQVEAYTALSIASRARTMTVLGDPKQICPRSDISEEVKNALETSLSELQINAPHLLMPGEGHSLYNLGQVLFPRQTEILTDQFRCTPDGIGWSNENVYHGKIKNLKPSVIARTLHHTRVAGKYDQSREVNEEEAKSIVQSAYRIAEHSAKEGLNIDAPPPTMGILSVGGPKQVKCIEKLLSSTLDPLDVEFGQDTVEKHKIIVREVAEIQGGERDIILISFVYDSGTVPHETGADSERIYNVMNTRHLKHSHSFSSYGLNDIKRGDIKRGVFASYMAPGMGSEIISWQHLKEGDVRLLAEKKLYTALLEMSFQVKRNKGNVWENALVVGLDVKTESSRYDFGSSLDDRCAYLCVGNHGESDEEWDRMVDEQHDLEKAGVACMRLDVLDLALCFDDRLKDIRRFLTEAGLDQGMAVANKSNIYTSQSNHHNSPESAIVAAIPPDSESDLTSMSSSSITKRRGAGRSTTARSRESQKSKTSTTATSSGGGTQQKKRGRNSRGDSKSNPPSKAAKKSRTKK